MNRRQRLLAIVTLWVLALMCHIWSCDWGRGKGSVVVSGVGIVVRSQHISSLEGFLLGIVTPISLTSLGLFVFLGRRGRAP